MYALHLCLQYLCLFECICIALTLCLSSAFRLDRDLVDDDPETNGIMNRVSRLKTSRIFSWSQRWLRSLLSSITVSALLLYGQYFTNSLLWISSLCILFLREFHTKVSVRHFEWHCFCQTADWRRHREKCCANEIVWPTSFSAIHFSKDTERAFIQVNHDCSPKWKRVFRRKRSIHYLLYWGC